MASAQFSIDDDSGSGGVEVANGQTLTLRLLQQPPIGVHTVQFQVWNPDAADPTLGIAANPPRASKGAPLLTLEGATSGQAVSPATVDGEVTVDMPASGGHSYIIRCIINGGLRTVGTKQVVDPSLIAERGVWTPTAGGLRKAVATEVAQFETEGWAGALADMADAAGGGGVTDPLLVHVVRGPTGEVQVQGFDESDNGGRLLVSPLVSALTNNGDGEVNVSSALGGSMTLAPLGHESMPVDTSLLFTSEHEGDAIEILRLGLIAGAPAIGFLGQLPATRPSIGPGTTQEQLDQVIDALELLGLISDDRVS